jgi:hypothetical protein
MMAPALQLMPTLSIGAQGGGETFQASAETAQFLSRISDPGFGGKTAYNNFINTLVSAGIWSVLDGLYIPSYDNTQATFLVNLKQSAFGGTITGTSTYVPGFGHRNTGVAGTGGANSYISTGFTPSTAGGNYAQNSAHLMVFSFSGSPSPVGNSAHGADNATNSSHIFPCYTDGKMYFRINDNSASPSAGLTGIPTSGCLLGNRSASNAVQWYRNGASIGSAATASAALINIPLLFTAVNNAGTIRSKCRGIYQAFSWGGSLNSTQVAAFYNALLTYMAAAGYTYEFWSNGFTTASEELYFSKGDGTAFVDQGAVYSKTPDAAVRDPTIYRDTNGDLYSAYTRVHALGDATSTFTVARSTDGGANWTRLGTIECSALTGGAGTGRVWAPKFFLDSAGSGNLYIFFCYDEDTSGEDFQIGAVQITDLPTLAVGTPVAVTGTAIAASVIDGWPVRNGSTYYLFHKNETDERIKVVSSSSLLSGYDTLETTITTAIASGIGAVNVEAPCMIQMSGNYWRLYYDRYSASGESHSDTFDNWVTFESPVNVSQTVLSPVRHATVIKV